MRIERTSSEARRTADERARVRAPRVRLRRSRLRNRAIQSRESSNALATWLSSWGTFLSAVAAAAGLIISGIATYAAVQTVEDQRATLEEEQAEELRSQASRVTAWQRIAAVRDTPLPEGGALHVRNRSPDAITGWGIVFDEGRPSRVKPGSAWPPEETLSSDTAMYILYTPLPPCSELIVDVEQLLDDPDSFVGVSFYDSRGVRWIRLRDGKLRQSNIEPVIVYSRFLQESAVVKLNETARVCETH